MTKRRRLTLARETLRALTSAELHRAGGGFVHSIVTPAISCQCTEDTRCGTDTGMLCVTVQVGVCV